jgi:phage baseplate assembly protein W
MSETQTRLGQARLGSDLRLLADLERANERSGGSDLMRIAAAGGSDLTTVRDVPNMQQALLLRFLTRQGDLTPLGHPDYGSRLYTLIGELNNATNRNRAKLFVLEALGAEPRVQSVAAVTVTAGARDRIDIAVSLTVIGSDTPLNLVFPFFLGGSG